MTADDLVVRSVADDDRALLRSFECSTGTRWEDDVQTQVREHLASRYLSTPPYFDGRMLFALDGDGRLIVVGAHHIEPGLSPDIGYTEVLAVATEARGTLVEMPDTVPVTLGHFMLLTIFKQMRQLGRHQRTFVRVDRRNTRSLNLLDRVGLREERPDPVSEELVQRWGELP